MIAKTIPMTIEGIGRLLFAAFLLAYWGVISGCTSPPVEPASSAAGKGWSVTAWGKHFEVFPQAGALVVGETAVAHTHVTHMEGFAPLENGEVSLVLSGPSGEEVFSAASPVRPGIFAIEIEPESPGERNLSFRIRGAGGEEEIRGGKVQIGTAQQPGGLLVAPAPKGATDIGEPLPFLKEEQWRSDFSTTWVRSGQLARSVRGLARIRPPAGGEVLITAPVAGVLQPASGVSSWPFEGRQVKREAALFMVVPHVAADRSLSSLKAELTALAAEKELASARHSRLKELFALDATSQREVGEAQVKAESLEARHSAASRDLAAAQSSRQGSPSARGLGPKGLPLRAPLAGKVAEVWASPGATVSPGDSLARLVSTDAVWVQIAISPSDAQEIANEGVRGLVLTNPETAPIHIESGLRLISIAPEVDLETGTVNVLLEAPPTPGLVLGSVLEAQVLSKLDRQGIVIPASAVVDDGGIDVVYLQISGERFLRQQVDVIERQGDRLLVERLSPGQRLVSRGGEVIRRSSLMASGGAHGHVH